MPFPTKKDYLRFGQFGGLFGRIEPLTKRKYEATCYHLRQPGSDTSEHSPDLSQYNPDLWVDEYYFLNQPGQADIQLDLFYDYQNNVKSYPKWQQWLRDHQPPLLVLWGRYDTSFTVAGGEAYHRDDPRAEVHILDAGHFALDLKAQEIIRLTEAFLDKQQIK
jgi:pimeloyl-ACP methyl ester carboxylesterase